MFSNIKGSSHKLAEWISDSNVLLAIVIGIIFVFLIVCVLVFYCAFFPDGIPEHLTRDAPESEEDKEEEAGMLMGGNNMMMMDANMENNGNGTNLM